MELIISRQQLGEAYKSAPAHVRAAYTSDITGVVMSELQKKYGLHVDVAGTLSKMVAYMLLGLISPTVFYSEILALGINAPTADAILKEINEKIFLPLQQKMRDGVPVPEEDEDEWEESTTPLQNESAQQPVAPAVPVMQVGTPEPVPTTTLNTTYREPIPQPIPTPTAPSINVIDQRAPVAQPQPLINREDPITPTFVPTPPQQTVLQPTPQTTSTGTHEMLVHPRTMQEDMVRAGQGGFPPANLPTTPPSSGPFSSTPIAAAPMPVSVGQSSPARAFQTSSIPNTAHDIPEQVQVIRSAPVPLRDTFRSAPLQHPEPVKTVQNPITHDYATDPYRELPQ